jgi:hypothetical protein
MKVCTADRVAKRVAVKRREPQTTPDTSLLKRATITAPRFQSLSSEDSTPYAVLAFDADQSSAKAARNVVQRE